MFNTLYSKLSISLFGLICLIGFLFFLLVRFSSEMYQQEVNQKLNNTLATHIVSEDLLLKHGDINKPALEDIFHMLMVINPSIEIYLLDKDGTILGYSAPQGKVKRKIVNLKPVKEFLAGHAHYPLLGDDPRDFGRQKVFSAARIPSDGPLEGYLYVILAGEQYDSVAHMLQDSYILRFSMWGIGASLLFAMLAGLAIFALLTRRLSRLSQAMNVFAEGQYDDPEQARYKLGKKSGDEIDRLGGHFNNMAERISQQMDELRKIDTVRRELVANVSHDLRTPLASLHGYLETLLLKDESLSPEDRRRYLEIAISHSDRLGKLVEELFELAKLDSTESVVYDEPFSLAELAQDIVQKFQLSASEKQINLGFDFGKKLPVVHGDIGLMQRVLENLIENALRHTPKGGRITLTLMPESDKVVVKVSDTGCGIPKEALPHVFDRFYQLEKSRQNTSGSAGLGLAIAKRILELHGSPILVDSEVNTGTTFTFFMPVHHY